MHDGAAIYVDTDFGRMRIVEEGGAITRLDWDCGATGMPSALLAEAVEQLRAYLAGALTRFDLPLRVAGSDFQRAVCDAMCAIPFGQTCTYGRIAADLGASAQAVGRACSGNPIAVIIPCHRVLGADGRLTGYSGGAGVETKVALLRHEGAAGLLI